MIKEATPISEAKDILECKYCHKKTIYFSKVPFTDKGTPTRTATGVSIPIDAYSQEPHLCQENPLYPYLKKQYDANNKHRKEINNIAARYYENMAILELMKSMDEKLDNILGLAMEVQVRTVEELVEIRKALNITSKEN